MAAPGNGSVVVLGATGSLGRRVAARAAALLPAPPLTPAQVALMARDNVVGEGVATFADLGIAPRGPAALGLV